MSRFILSVVVGLAVGIQGSGQTLSPEAWAEDIDFFDIYVRTHHPNPFDKADEAEWQRQIAELRAEVDGLPEGHAALYFHRLMALLEDGHSYLNWDTVKESLHAAPLILRRFSDGVFVVRALDEELKLEGARVTSVGGMGIDDLAVATGVFATDDNVYAAAQALAWNAVQRECLEIVGACEVGGAMEYTFVMPDGTERRESFEAMTLGARAEAFDALPAESLEEQPLYRQRPDDIYWYTVLDESGGMYVKFSSVRSQRGNPFSLWTKKLMKEAVAKDVPFIVVDVRMNGGGNGNLLRPLIERLAESPWGQTPGRLYVITAPRTFSAAMMFVTRMERATEVRFAGEPAGGRPNHYGDNEPFELPNSGIGFRLSSLYHEESDPDDDRAFQEVHVPAPLSARDYWTGRDPSLEAVIRDHKTFFPSE